MDKPMIFDSLISIILIFGYINIEDKNNFILLIYVFIVLYNAYISIFVLIENFANNKIKIKLFIIASILIYFFSYFIIIDTNPFLIVIFYYLFFPYFWKAFFIVFIHSYILSKFLREENNHIN